MAGPARWMLERAWAVGRSAGQIKMSWVIVSGSSSHSNRIDSYSCRGQSMGDGRLMLIVPNIVKISKPVAHFSYLKFDDFHLLNLGNYDKYRWHFRTVPQGLGPTNLVTLKNKNMLHFVGPKYCASLSIRKCVLGIHIISKFGDTERDGTSSLQGIKIDKVNTWICTQ